VTADEDVAPEPRASRFSWLAPKPSGKLTDPELRHKMRTLDPTERKWGWIAPVVLLAVAGAYIPRLSHNTSSLSKKSPVKGVCPHNYNLVGKLCEQTTIYHPSQYVPEFILVIVASLVLFFAIWRSMRVLTIVVSFLGALIAGSLALLVLFAYGAWLMLRSWRLSRYGATDAATVKKVATERAVARREAKTSAKSETDSATPAPRKVDPSKRYTPKAKSRRR
jgi:hypothetical protein